jgi:hypothetical protein
VKGRLMEDYVKKPYRIIFRVHALRQMFNRRIGDDDVKDVIKSGRIIEEYPDDIPYPSYLLNAIIRGRPLHVVVAYNKKEGVVIVITAYEPEIDRWEDNYTRRKL